MKSKNNSQVKIVRSPSIQLITRLLLRTKKNNSEKFVEVNEGSNMILQVVLLLHLYFIFGNINIHIKNKNKKLKL